MKKSFYFILLLFSFQFSTAQDNLLIRQELDREYEKISFLKTDEDVKKIQELIESSKRINYKEGIGRGKIKMMSFFYNRSDYQKTLELIRETESLGISDKEQLSVLHLFKSYVNKELGIEKEGFGNIKDALKYSKQIKDTDTRHFRNAFAYNILAAYFDYKSADSLIYYLKKVKEELEQISDKNIKLKTDKQSSILFNNLNIGNFYLGVHKPQRLDLAEPYYMKAYEFKNTHPEIFEQRDMPILCGVGRFYMEKGEYEKSIELANEILEIEKSKKNPAYRLYAYMLLDDSYGGLKRPEEQVKYTKLYATLNDSLNKVAKKEANQEFDRLVTVNEEKKDKEYISNLKIILLSTSCFILLSGFIIWIYWKRKNKIIHKKYEALIAKINAEKVQKDNPAETHIISEITETKSTILVSDEVAKYLLIRLEKFERSEKYLQKDISLSWLASSLNTNTKYLSEVIKIYKNKNFNNYINGLRISYLLHKLVSEPVYREYKIVYLAETCGYASHQVFSIAFQKETGFKPSYFIANLKKDSSAESLIVQ